MISVGECYDKIKRNGCESGGGMCKGLDLVCGPRYRVGDPTTLPE